MFPCNPKKERMNFIENKDVKINIRVTKDEKRILSRKAKRAGLNLSEYLRKCGLNEEVRCLPSEYLKQLFCFVADKNYDVRIVRKLLLDLYNERKSEEVESYRYDENLAD